ncbi:MAG: phage minor head protein, partial [Bdellovibrionales bacterium]
TGYGAKGQRTDPYQRVENEHARTGRIGKYQMRAEDLRDIEYYVFAETEETGQNTWKGKWLGKRAITTLEDFLKNKEAQEYIIREEMNLMWGQVHKIHLDGLVGETIKGILVTESGLLAGAHMFGVIGVMYLLDETKSIKPTEQNLLNLLKGFSGFQTPFSKQTERSHASAEFVRYLKTGLAPRVSQEVAALPEEQVTRYVWRTQGDGKVRSSHAQNNGKIFDCTNPPETGNPGDDYGCRCWAEKCVSSDYLPHDYNLRPDNPAKPVKELRTSEKGAKFIREWEAFYPTVYPDQSGNPTIGFGHLIQPGEKFPSGISREAALALFYKDLREREKIVHRLLRIPLTQNQFDALSSLVYNWNEDSFKTTRCLRYLNEGKFQEAKPEFIDINKFYNEVTKRHEVSDGLLNRRIKEWDLFENGVYDASH